MTTEGRTPQEAIAEAVGVRRAELVLAALAQEGWAAVPVGQLRKLAQAASDYFHEYGDVADRDEADALLASLPDKAEEAR